MLENIGAVGYETLSSPNMEVLSCVNEKLMHNSGIIYYEIGVGVGATTLPVSKLISESRGNGKIYIFSRAHDVSSLIIDLNNLGYNFITGIGSPNKKYSGYHFEIADAFLKSELPQFDVAYLDGGHVFHLDAPTTCILKELCKPDGYIIFDDYNWSLKNSPTLNPETNPDTRTDYDDKQIHLAHVEMVCKSLMDTDSRYTLVNIKNNSAVYKRTTIS